MPSEGTLRNAFKLLMPPLVACCWACPRFPVPTSYSRFRTFSDGANSESNPLDNQCRFRLLKRMIWAAWECSGPVHKCLHISSSFYSVNRHSCLQNLLQQAAVKQAVVVRA